ncbi:MAG: hypothetical protein ACXVHT_04885 [Methanobacterium sp.]
MQRSLVAVLLPSKINHVKWFDKHDIDGFKNGPLYGKHKSFYFDDLDKYDDLELVKYNKSIFLVIGSNSNIELGGNILGDIYNIATSLLKSPQNKPPKRLRSLLEKIGNKKVIGINVVRTPINSTIETIVNWISLGQYEQNKKNLKYDNVFHLYLRVMTEDKVVYRLEKNQVVHMWEIPQKNIHEKNAYIPITIKSGFTMNDFLKSGEEYQNKAYNGKLGFWLYDAQKNNCQIFCNSMLSGASSKGYIEYPHKTKLFILQDGPGLLSTFVARVARGVTDTAANFEVLLHGEGMEYESSSDSDDGEVCQDLEYEKPENTAKLLNSKSNTGHFQSQTGVLSNERY